MMTFPFVLLAPQYHMFDHQLVVLLEAIQYLLIIIIIHWTKNWIYMGVNVM